MSNNEKFRDWCEHVVRTALNHQDKSINEMIRDKIIPTWAEWVIKNQ